MPGTDRRGTVFRDFFAGLTVTVLVAVGVLVYDAVEHFDASNVFVAESWVPIASTAVAVAVKSGVAYMIDYLLKALRRSIRDDQEEDKHE